MTGRAARRAFAVVVVLAAAAACTENPPPAVITTPKYPELPAPTVPAALKASSDTTASHDEAWRRLQSGDASGARRVYQSLLKKSPAFYPAETGLGLVALAGRDYKEASAHFAAAIARNPKYMPALEGAAQAAIGSGDDGAAIDALQAVLKVEPGNESARHRLDVVKLRQVQSSIESARRARESGKFDEAETILERASAASPSAAVLLRELAAVELAKDAWTAGEGNARKALQIDPGDAMAWVVLGDILDKEGRFRDAADAYGKAIAIDPRPAWRDRREALRTKADDAALPSEFRAIGTATSVTRGDVAAMIGLRLGPVLDRSSRRLAVVATDVRAHWAANWILEVVQAGVMDVFPNHTFQPDATVRRGELARVMAEMLTLISTERPTDLARWKSAHPVFTDVPATHLSYPAVALAVSAGVLQADGDRFGLTRQATGAELTAAVGRLQQIAR